MLLKGSIIITFRLISGSMFSLLLCVFGFVDTQRHGTGNVPRVMNLLFRHALSIKSSMTYIAVCLPSSCFALAGKRSFVHNFFQMGERTYAELGPRGFIIISARFCFHENTAAPTLVFHRTLPGWRSTGCKFQISNFAAQSPPPPPPIRPLGAILSAGGYFSTVKCVAKL